MVKVTQLITLLALTVAGSLAKKCNQPTTPGQSNLPSEGNNGNKPSPTDDSNQPKPTPEVPINNPFLSGLGYNAKHSNGGCPELVKVVDDFNTMLKVTNRIRTFGLMDCNQGELMLQASEKTGLKVYLGMFLNQNPQEFNNEFAKLKDLINRYRSTFEKNIPAIIVGSECLYRKELNFDQLADYIKQVKQFVQVEANLPNIKITTADTKDQWYPHATLNAVDFMMVNAYPYWESIGIDNAIEHLFQTIGKVKGATKEANKPFVLGETGWPMGGKTLGPAIPSKENQIKYFNQFYCRAKAENLDYFYFSAFDEAWKQDEGNANWGIFKEGDKKEKDGYSYPPSC